MRVQTQNKFYTHIYIYTDLHRKNVIINRHKWVQQCRQIICYYIYCFKTDIIISQHLINPTRTYLSCSEVNINFSVKNSKFSLLFCKLKVITQKSDLGVTGSVALSASLYKARQFNNGNEQMRAVIVIKMRLLSWYQGVTDCKANSASVINCVQF